MAAPHVSGLAALAVAATDGRIEPDGLQTSLIDTAVHPDGPNAGPDHRHGHGVVDAPAAVAAAVDTAPPPESEPAENGDDDTGAGADGGPNVDDDAPGFGVAPAVVAVVVALAGLLSAGRRHDGPEE